MAKIIIIGAGMGGLAAALLLAAAGREVILCEAADAPGGKLRTVNVAGQAIDAGPTVFTMKPVFEAIFAQAGCNFSDDIKTQKLNCLARHAWEDGAPLDLYDDAARNTQAIGDFAGAQAARGYKVFAGRAKKIYETLDASFMQIPQPGLGGLLRRAGTGLLGISPFASLWDELGTYFADARLRQLFARYATYCGSSPFAAPATLMLIAHAELCGVWRIEGGMARLADAFERRARAAGALFRYSTKVQQILAQSGRVSGVMLANGEQIMASHVIVNADVAALDAGLFGPAAKAAVAGMMRGAQRSLSALTWAATGQIDSSASGLAAAHHNVFFARDYVAEFRALGEYLIPCDPTVYVCAQGGSKFFLLVNAPAGSTVSNAEGDKCLSQIIQKLRRCGLTLQLEQSTRTGPAEFAQTYPSTGGALYGRALTGWRDSFRRPGAMTRLPGLYLAGGSVHPGPGLPMAAISGRIAAQCVLSGR